MVVCMLDWLAEQYYKGNIVVDCVEFDRRYDWYRRCGVEGK